MMEHHRADASFRVHHHPFGQLHSDFFLLQKLPEADLVVEVGASRIAKAVAFPAITRSETLRHRKFGRIGETPVFADPTMQPFSTSFRGLDSERLQPVRFEVVPLVFCLFAALANAFTRGNHKKSHVVALSVLWCEHVIAEAKKIAGSLPLEIKCVQRRDRSRLEKV